MDIIFALNQRAIKKYLASPLALRSEIDIEVD